MTIEEFSEDVVGIDQEFLESELEAECDVQGPWNPRSLLDMKLEVDGRQIGAHIEFVLDDEGTEVQSLECLEVYDLEGLEEDDDVSDGEEIPKEGKLFESILDEIAEQLGCNDF